MQMSVWIPAKKQTFVQVQAASAKVGTDRNFFDKNELVYPRAEVARRESARMVRCARRGDFSNNLSLGTPLRLCLLRYTIQPKWDFHKSPRWCGVDYACLSSEKVQQKIYSNPWLGRSEKNSSAWTCSSSVFQYQLRSLWHY